MKRTGNSSQAVLVPLGVFSLKRSTVGAFAVPVRVLSQKKYDRRYTVMVETQVHDSSSCTTDTEGSA